MAWTALLCVALTLASLASLGLYAWTAERNYVDEARDATFMSLFFEPSEINETFARDVLRQGARYCVDSRCTSLQSTIPGTEFACITGLDARDRCYLVKSTVAAGATPSPTPPPTPLANAARFAFEVEVDAPCTQPSLDVFVDAWYQAIVDAYPSQALSVASSFVTLNASCTTDEPPAYAVDFLLLNGAASLQYAQLVAVQVSAAEQSNGTVLGSVTEALPEFAPPAVVRVLLDAHWYTDALATASPTAAP